MPSPFRCTFKQQITEDICLLQFKPQNDPIVYTPGQYVLAILPDGQKIALSIAGESQGILEFHLRHNDSQPLAQKLLAHIEITPTISMEGPYGQSTTAQLQLHKPVLFLSGGTGFAPFQSLIAAILNSSYQQKISLYWGIRRPQDAYALSLIEKWQQKHAHFEFNLILSENIPKRWLGATGLLPDFVSQKYNDMSNLQVFASGPLAMVKQALQKCVAKGLLRDLFYTDLRFTSDSSR